MRITKSLLMGLLALMLCSSVFAYGGGDDKEGKQCEYNKEEMRAKHDAMFEQLGLSEDQKVQLKEIRKGKREKGGNLHKTLREKKQALREAFDADTLDEGKISALSQEVKDLQSKMVDKRVDGVKAIRSVLTVDQYRQFKEIKKDSHGKRKQRKERKGSGQ